MLLARVLFALALSAMLLGAQESKPKTVKELLTELGATDFAIRERASRALIQRGREVRPSLEKALEGADLETRLRIESILDELPVNSETRKTSLDTTRIDLRVKDRPLSEVLRLIEERSPARFRRPCGLAEDLSVTLDLTELPLLETLDRLAESLGSRWLRDYRTDLLRFTPNPGARPHYRYFGPLRVAFSGISRNRSLTFGLPPKDQGMVQGQIDLEPGSEILGVWAPPVLNVLEDDRGGDLLPADPLPARFTAARDRKSFHFTLPFAPPSDEATKIATLEGHFRLVVGTRYQKLELRPESGSSVRDGKVEMRIVSQTDRGQERLLVLEFQRQAVSADAAATRTIFDERVTLFDRQGKPITPIAPAMIGTRGSNGTLTFRVSKATPVAKIQALVLQECREERVDFKFENIPLP